MIFDFLNNEIKERDFIVFSNEFGILNLGLVNKVSSFEGYIECFVSKKIKLSERR